MTEASAVRAAARLPPTSAPRLRRPSMLDLALLPALTLLATPQLPVEPPIPFGDRGDATWDAPWSPDTTYDDSIPTFDAFLGAPAGSRLAHGDTIEAAFEAWAEQSPRMVLVDHGVTHEGRRLFHAVISSEGNIARLDTLLEEQQRFADPRLEGASDLVDGLPAFAWMGYSIHGDETSGADAAPVIARHLIAGTSDDVTGLLDELVVVIDPNMNPDGRERFLSELEWMDGYVADLDHASMQRGRWPFGRGNHYLFDMNRDWIAGVAPETRARWKAVRRYWPQLFVDGHEMGGLDTFLTYPQAEARHPRLPQTLLGWQSKFADDLAAAFDSFAWGYYTREWADGWGPFYSDAWGSLTGAVGILYEQARGAGRAIRRASGEIVPYREAVHGQFVASLANLRTLAENRAAIREDYFEARRAAVEEVDPSRVFAAENDPLRPGRLERLRSILDGQGIEYRVVTGGTLENAVDALGREAESVELPARSVVVPLAQPQGRLVSAFLDFDSRMPADYLTEERADLERDGYGNVYDTTAWSLGHALDLRCWWGDHDPVEEIPPGDSGRESFGMQRGTPSIGWAVHGTGDGAPRQAARLMELGVQVKVSDRAFASKTRQGDTDVRLERGGLLIARHENDELGDLDARIEQVRSEVGMNAVELRTQRAPDLEQPDLGGGHFALLERPRVAILSNAPVEAAAFGHLWHHLDVELGLATTMLDAMAFGGYDLRRYNVLVLPPGDLSGFLAEHADSLRTWVEAGGTLIACGSAAAAIANEELGLSEVRLRRDVLAEVSIYRAQAELALAAGERAVDPDALYAGTVMSEGQALRAVVEAENVEGLERHDAWARRFAPSGVVLRGLVDEEHWLTVGCRDELPVLYSGAHVLLHAGATPVRLADGDDLRLAGLLWPEARERLALGAYATVERRGDGQVILFAADPSFRGYWMGTARLFSNAVVYGPGLGANAPVPR